MRPLKQSVHSISRYFWNILIAIDQFFNAVLAGDPDETMSSRFGKWRTIHPRGSWRWFVSYWVCRGLHLLDPGHCEECIETDEGQDAVIK